MSTKIKEIEDLEVGVETKIMQVPVETSTPVIHRFNAMPLAFSGFAVASVLLGFVSTGLITDVNVVGVGACIASAGLGLLIASISELLKGELFSGNIMGVFSGFYIAYGILFMPSTGFVAMVGAEADGAREVQKCAALFSLAYAVPAFLFFLATFKQPWLIRLLMVQVTLAYILSGVGNAMPSNTIIAAGGWFSITTGLTAWYMMAAMIYTKENTYFTLPVF